MVVLLFWSGLAWTQTPPSLPSDLGERIMVVHENGKSTRCRVLETWQLSDARVAHLLEALETREKITIVDEQGLHSETIRNSPGVPKRIFAWGLGRTAPPQGSPIPPHLRLDSGVVIKNEIPPPGDSMPTQDPIVVTHVVDEQAPGGPIIRENGAIPIVEKRPAGKAKRTFLARFLPKRFMVTERPAAPEVVAFGESTLALIPQGPPLAIVNETPIPPAVNSPPVIAEDGPEPFKIDVPPPPTVEQIVPVVKPAPTETSNASPSVAPPLSSSNQAVAAQAGLANTCDLNANVTCQPAEATARKRWYPGANVMAWLQGKSKPTVSPTETAKTEAAKTPQDDDAKKLKQAQDFLAQQNTVADKQLTEKIEKLYGTPFSTARAPESNAQQPQKQPGPPLLATANKPAKDEQPSIAAPAPKIDTPKPSTASDAQKRDIWGNVVETPIVPPGKSLLDPAPQRLDLAKLPPPARPNDPLLAPEKLVPKDDRLRPKIAGPGPAPTRAAESDMLPNPSDMPLPPNQARPTNWPLGTQSVQAANSGLFGTPMYIPVPTVTVPQPHHPPAPPPPNLPEAPNLNAYVNAFTPPPPPKGAPSQQQTQGMLPPQATAAYGNPALTQQMIMTQQQMMAQHQMLAQQQMMMQYGYRPNPALMSPYMPPAPGMMQGMPSAGPMTNFSRQYAGPQAPNPFAANPAVQTGYAGPPYSVPAQQPALQPVAYKQNVPPQQPITQQVEQLVKVLRESPYPAQREWAAQSLTSFEWRDHAEIVPALTQSASQDPAASVRAGCAYCLGRMHAAVEPVFGTLHAMRNDRDPRVRAEVDQALARLRQTPTTPQ
jgi:hypothetical protein